MLTKYFKRGTRPVNVGVYTTLIMHKHFFQFWNGARWGAYCPTIAGAEKLGKVPSSCQNPRWCGLAENPNPPKAMTLYEAMGCWQ